MSTLRDRLRPALVVLAATAASLALGRVVAATWVQGLIDTLATAGLDLSAADPAGLSAGIWTAAAMVALSGPGAALSVGLTARMRAEAPTVGAYLRAVAVLIVGANLGISVKAVSIARILVPRAVEGAAGGGALAIDAGELGLWPWALAGVFCALVLHLAITGVSAVLADERTR